MKLIGSHTSPYARKVRIVLAEKKIEYDFVLDSPWAADSKVPDINPLGKIPVLVLDDETPLFDSRVIVEYIDNVTPNNKLFPAPNRERIEVKRWEALADGLCDAAVAALLEGKRPATPEGAAWIARQRDKVARSLEFMAEALGDKSFAWVPTSRWPTWPWAPHSATCASASRTSPGRMPTPTWPSCTTS